MIASSQLVFALDVDHKVIDNDRIEADLKYHLQRHTAAAAVADRPPGGHT